jgi:hypothetical protein
MLLSLLLSLCAAVPARAQVSITYSFVNGTTADADQVNANFNALGTQALNRTGGTMTGTLTSRAILPSADATYAFGDSTHRYTTGNFSDLVTAAALLLNNASDIEFKDSGAVARTTIKGLASNDVQLRALAAGKQIQVRNFIDSATTVTIDADLGTFTTSGAVFAAAFSGIGTGLTALTAAQLTGPLPAISGASLTSLNATNISSGTLDTARLPGTITVSGVITASAYADTGTALSSIYGLWLRDFSLFSGRDSAGDGTLLVNQQGYALGGFFRDLAIYDGKGAQIGLFTGKSNSKGEYLANGYSLNVGATSYLGRGTNPTNAVNCYPGTAPIGAAGGHMATLYCENLAGSTELRVMDEAGNATTISPHDHVTGKWIFRSTRPDGSEIVVQMEDLVKWLDARFGTGFVSDTQSRGVRR